VSCTAPLACTATGATGISTGANGVAGVFVASTLASTATAESLSTGKVTYGHEQADFSPARTT
jgi:hypothetical protein